MCIYYFVWHFDKSEVYEHDQKNVCCLFNVMLTQQKQESWSDGLNDTFWCAVLLMTVGVCFQGCYEKVEEWLDENKHLLGTIAMCVLVIQVSSSLWTYPVVKSYSIVCRIKKRSHSIVC